MKFNEILECIIYIAITLTVAVVLVCSIYYALIEKDIKYSIKPIQHGNEQTQSRAVGSIVYLYDRPVIIIDTIRRDGTIFYKTGLLNELHHYGEETYMHIMPYTPDSLFNNVVTLP